MNIWGEPSRGRLSKRKTVIWDCPGHVGTVADGQRATGTLSAQRLRAEWGFVSHCQSLVFPLSETHGGTEPLVAV